MSRMVLDYLAAHSAYARTYVLVLSSDAFITFRCVHHKLTQLRLLIIHDR